MTAAEESKQKLLEAYRSVQADLPGQAGWLKEVRENALERFDSLGFPTRKQEPWRYTNVRALVDYEFDSVRSKPSGEKVPSAGLEGIPDRAFRLVFVDGEYSAELSQRRNLPKGLQMDRLSEILSSDPDLLESHFKIPSRFSGHSFVSLNTAFMEEGVFLRVAKDQSIAEPVYLVFISSGKKSFVNPRHFIFAEAGSQCSLIEHYVHVGETGTFTNAVTEIETAREAHLNYVRVQEGSDSAYHLGVSSARLAADSTVRAFSFSAGGALARHEMNVELLESGAHCTLNGVYLAKDKQYVENRTTVEHRAPGCKSEQYYKGILGGQSQGVFSGKVWVAEGAVGTDAVQTNKNLLLSETAEADTKPELEIYADDVKCSHGATVGQLDEKALFYLLSRGIDREKAKAILTSAFARDILEGVTPSNVRERLSQSLSLWLRSQGKEGLDGNKV